MSIDSHEISAFLAQLHARVSDRSTEVTGDAGEEVLGAAFREAAFTQVVLEMLEDLGQVSGAEDCFFEKLVGRHKVCVNGWNFEEDEAQLDVITTILREPDSPPTVPRGALLRAARQASHLIPVAGREFYKEVEPASDVFAMLQRVHEVMDKIERVRLIVLVDGTAVDPSGLEVDLEGVEVQIDVWDHQRLFRAQASGLPYEPITIDIEERLGESLPCLEVPAETADYRVYLAIVPGTLLHSLYHEFGSRLLELNVRSFLMLRGKVNKGIRKTILEQPERFMAYNNGLCITAESLALADRSDGGMAIRGITGMQIVNGGQTVATIHRAVHVDRADLSRVFVQAKITVVNEEQIGTLVPLVSRFANSQNKVNEADFSANSKYHVKLQQLSETVWCPGEATRWFYERARGQYQVARAREGTTPMRKKAFDSRTPSKQKFDKVQLAKYTNAWSRLPHVVSRGGQKNFAAFTQWLAREYGDDWEPDTAYYTEVIAKAIIYKTAEKIARRHAFTGYRANAVTYTVALFSWRTAGRVDLSAIWDARQVSPTLESVLHDWMPEIHEAIVQTAGDRNVTEWCKREECWREIQTIDLNLPRELLDELSEGQPLPNVGARSGQSGKLSEEDRESIARVMQAGPETWLHVVKWGTSSGKLKTWELGIATTLASYAAMEWTKVPSAKQAKHGVRMLAEADNL